MQKRLDVYLSENNTEKSRIYEKMLGMGIRSLSAYIRKMALDEIGRASCRERV